MASVLHEALVEMLRESPQLVEALLRAARFPLPEHDAVTQVSESLGDAKPRELRGDGVFRFDRAGEPVLTAVMEVQLNVDDDKRFSWPLYVAGVWSRHGCEVVLAVITPSRRVAQWARQAIVMGAGHVVTPLVLGPEEVAWVTDLDEAKRQPELAAFCAMAHGQDRDARRAATAAMTALSAVRATLKGEKFQHYYELVYAALGEAARKAFDMFQFPPDYEFQNPHARRALAKERAEGQVSGQALSIIAVLETRGLDVTAAHRERILSCTDSTELQRLLRLAVTSPSVEALFAH